MTTKVFRLIALCAGLFLFTSCFTFRDIEVKDFSIDNISMQGKTIVADFSATVHNPNRTFVIQSVTGDLSRQQAPFASAYLAKPLTILGKSEHSCSGQLVVSIQDLLAALQLGANYKSWDVSSFLFTGDVLVRAAWMKKRLTYKDMPLDQFINSLQ